MKYLITGGTGSFGKTMLSRLLEKSSTESVTVLSRDEEKQDALRNIIKDPRVKWRIGDIRDRSSVESAVAGVNFVFHAAALKQVPSCEFFPSQAVLTNIIGSENVIRESIKAGVKSVVCLSTDKAVFPVNAMGMSKAMMEKLAQAAARELGENSTTMISCVRYGNVMFSRGSVIPLFLNQIEKGIPITLTEPSMTRFLMPLRDSVSLVEYAFENANQGDLFIQKASASTMSDLLAAIKNITKATDHPVDVIGWRHGEKLYETLASASELANAEDLGEYWRLRMNASGIDYKPFFTEGDSEVVTHDDFHSHNANQLDAKGVEDLLRSIPEMKTVISALNEKNG